MEYTLSKNEKYLRCPLCNYCALHHDDFVDSRSRPFKGEDVSMISSAPYRKFTYDKMSNSYLCEQCYNPYLRVQLPKSLNKKEQREEINTLLEDYLDNGGKITICPYYGNKFKDV